MTHTWKIVLAVLRIFGGIVLLIIGLIGLAAPIMPGWAFIIPGVLLLAKDVPPVRRLVCWVLNSGPILRLEQRYPRLHSPLQRLRDDLRPHPWRHRHQQEPSTRAEPSEERDVA